MLSKLKNKNMKFKLAEINSSYLDSELDKIEESLPFVFRTDSMWNKFSHEVKVYHRWLGIIFYYSIEIQYY